MPGTHSIPTSTYIQWPSAPIYRSHTWPQPVTPHDTIAAYSDANQRRIYDACPHATEVRTFHGWLTAGRVVMKGQKGIRLVAPDTIDDAGKVRSIKPVHVFDVTQTQELAHRAA